MRCPPPEWMQTSDGHQYVLGRVGDPAPDAPLFIQFDGEMVVQPGYGAHPHRAHEAGRIPAMHVFFLHSGGRENRWKELNGDNPIADYLVEIAFPHLEAVHCIKTAPQNIVINGQSLGRAVLPAGGAEPSGGVWWRDCAVFVALAAAGHGPPGRAGGGGRD